MNLQSHYYKTVSKQYICGWQQNRGWTGKQDICGWPPSGLMLGTFMMMLATTMMMTTIRQANEHDDDVRPKNVALASFLNAWRASYDPHLPTISFLILRDFIILRDFTAIANSTSLSPHLSSQFQIGGLTSPHFGCFFSSRPNGFMAIFSWLEYLWIHSFRDQSHHCGVKKQNYFGHINKVEIPKNSKNTLFIMIIPDFSPM